ncbi:Sec-independent protein translocase protein TatB [Paracoccus ravus]|uniref:Sec-independent protein translocase protein TatB n=1 Tax=Paracoccus ravus TaxID=2447760 RepID=UPI00106EED27|nr:Sec-independent protein translocase protein TatB [Paracoccus ravus]
MLDIGWSELLLIGVVALIVIGPEDLPKLFRTLGRLTARARSMAREFTNAMEDAAKSSGLDEAGQALRDVKSLASKKSLGLDALERATERFEKWDPLNPKDQAAEPAAQPDPSAPAEPAYPAGSRFAQTGSAAPPASAPTPETPPRDESNLPTPPGVAAAHPVAAEMSESADASAGDTAGGKRRLHAVRRSDQ